MTAGRFDFVEHTALLWRVRKDHGCSIFDSFRIVANDQFGRLEIPAF